MTATSALSAPWMGKDEIELFDSVVSKARNYLEFGAGNSTRYVLGKFLPEAIYSVETNPQYLDKLRNEPDLREPVASGRLKLIHADIGRVKGAGYPVSMGSASLVKSYHQDIWLQLDRDFDTILIDGRFRRFTALMCLAYFPAATFIFHDFSNRPWYHGILPFIDVIAIRSSMIVYKSRLNRECAPFAAELVSSLLDPS